MAAASAELHEDRADLPPETIDHHRAIVSLMEELEAVDWYDQRIQAASDADLRAILAHNRDEEKEHAALLLEWLRRRDEALDAHLRTYLFTEGPLGETGGEASAHEPGPARASANGSLGIGGEKARTR